MLRIAVVEDDENDTKNLVNILEKYQVETGELFQVSRFRDAESLLTGYAPIYDVIFMDIMLGTSGINGIAAARRLRKYDAEVTLIFITTMTRFALNGYEVNAVDYFIKPVDYYKVKMRLDRIRRVEKIKDVYVTLSVSGGMMRIPSKNIYYIEVLGHTLYYHTLDGEYSARGTLSGVEKLLSPVGFARNGASYLVNLNYFRGIKGKVLLIGKNELRLTRGKKKEFMLRLNDYLNGEG